jgi:hypothetical protein
MKRFLVTTISILLLTFGLPSNSIAAELAGPKVSQRNSTSFEDATNSGITIDIYYTVEDESGVDENKIPETFIRLPGKELETSLRARPTLISGNIYNGSWLARFTYSKGIPPGIYVASTSTWYDTQSNPSSIPTAVTIRVDNLAVTSTTGENTPPSNLKCGSPQQIYSEEGETSNKLSASIFCTFTANSLRSGYKVNAYIDKIPLNVAMPTFDYANDQIVYPVVLAPQKIGKTFNLIGTFAGEYTLRIIVEFLGFPNLTQTFTVKLSETSNGQLPAAGSESKAAADKAAADKAAADKAAADKAAADKASVTNIQQAEFDTVKNDHETMMLRIANLKIKYPNNSNLIGMEAKMLTLPIILGKDLSTAKYNIVSVNKWLDGNEKVWEKTQKKTITCIKGKLTKKVTGLNLKCPKGYKVKA